jgi:hypothetical protein
MKTISLLCLVLAAGCGGGGVDSNVDPRCVTLCDNKEQGTGTGIVCTDDSVTQCKTACAAKIYGVSTVCGNCLLEGADFYGGVTVGSACQSFPGGTCGDGGGEVSCSSSNGGPTTCKTTVNGVSCSYDPENMAQVSACLMKQYPDGSTTCHTHFSKELKDCTAFCSGA